jgi:hypothetical protein
MRRLVLAAIPWLLASPAAGQSVFASAGAYANIQQFGHSASQSPVVSDDNLSDTTVGLALGVGGNVRRFMTVTLEIGLPGELHKALEPPRLVPPQPPLPSTTRRTVDYRTRHASAMIGYRAGAARRVSAVVFGGIMFVQERTHSLSVTTPTPSFNPLPSEFTSVTYRMAPVVGVDMPIAATSHFALVPQARLYKLTGQVGPLGFWPGLSLRWTF